jgi:DNA-binding CsgD family transcriptional regulator
MAPQLLEVIEAIYDAAAAPESWACVLDRISTIAGASSALLVYGDGDAPNPLATLGLDDTAVDDLTAFVLAAAGELPAGRLLQTSAALPRHREDSATVPTAEALTVVLLRDSSALSAMCLLAPPGGYLAPNHAKDLRRLLPHLRKAIAVHHRVDRAERRAALSSAAFDRMAIGAVMVDGRGRPLFANRAARRIAARRDGFSLDSGGLAACTQSATQALHQAIADVIRWEGGREAAGLRLPRPDPALPYEVIVLPLGRRRIWSLHHYPAAVVFVSDRGLPPAERGALLHDLYSLTAAEVRLALLLAAGSSPAQAAAALGISRHTTHSQLGSIFRKTGARSQSDLVRALLGGAVAVRPPGDSSDSHPAVVLPDLGPARR